MQVTEPIDNRIMFEEFLERKGLNKKNRSTIDTYLSYWDRFDINNGLSKDYINAFLNRYSSCVSRAFINNLIEFFELKDIKLPKLSGRKSMQLVKYLSKEEIDLVEGVMNCERNKIMVVLSFQAGLRLEELLGIKPKDFKWDKWKSNPKITGELVIRGKGNQERIVFIKPPLMLRLYEYVNSLRTRITVNDAIFMMKRTRWQKLVKNAGYKALNKSINPHMFRHSLATHLLEKGKDITKIKEFLGHKSIASTQIYIHVSKESLKKDFDDVF